MDVAVKVFAVDVGTGLLMDQIGTTYVTSTSDSVQTNHWLEGCTGAVCTFRHYAIADVPTERALAIVTSDANGAGRWVDAYDYDVYIDDDATCVPGGGPCVSSKGSSGWATRYDVTAVARADLASLTASVAGDVTIDPADGILVGEVHDCGDIRVSGANVDTGVAHVGPLFYFDGDEVAPLPDATRTMSDEGTSSLGRFGALDLAAGAAIRVSAIGIFDHEDTLLGTAVVQAYAGPSVTFITLRGRRAYQ